MPEPFGSDDLRVLSRYEFAGQGAWTTMPDEDKAAYRRINSRLEQILAQTFNAAPQLANADSCVTLGFRPEGGVRGNRPKDLWCAIFPNNAEAYMPQVYLIVSHRGIELGYAAAIHPKDFSDQAFKAKLKMLTPRIFDALPDPASEDTHRLSEKLTEDGGWYFRKKTRLSPKENDFAGLADWLTFLKSSEGTNWGAGTISRYWLPHEFTSEVDLGREFENAAQLFQPLMVRADLANVEPAPASQPLSIEAQSTPAPEDGIQRKIERFMIMYPERRSRPFATDEELWSVLKSLQTQFTASLSIPSRSNIRVNWSVGQGNWARVPWIAFLDARITETTQRGIYIALLFREDMSGAYLTFTQGVTEPKKIHGATSGLQLLQETAADLRRHCGALALRGFHLDNGIDLRTEGSLGRDYAAGTVAYKLYERGGVPDDAMIAGDLSALLDVYEGHIKARAEDRALGDDSEPRPIVPAPPYTMSEALADLFMEQEELEDLLTHWRTKKNMILQGSPGVGKTFVAKRLAFLMIGQRDHARLRMVQFHQAYSYEDFVQGYRPNENGGFSRRDGAFFDFAKLAEADPDYPYVFIIDEINRGNLSKILGELMMLIEADKRGDDHALPLSYSLPDEPGFSVPANLFLLGLMNTADRSLAMVDYALRRRFAFHTLVPRYDSAKFRSFLERRGVSGELVTLIVTRLCTLNEEIASDTVRLGPNYQIGHSFFTPSEGAYVPDLAWYRRVIKTEVAPLIQEYWFDNPEKAESCTATLLKNVV